MLNQFDTKSAIAISLVTSMIAMAFVLALRAPDSDIFKIVIGGLMTVGFSNIISFYFGSSSGSKAKDDTLNQIAITSSQPAVSVSSVAPALAPINQPLAAPSPPAN